MGWKLKENEYIDEEGNVQKTVDLGEDKVADYGEYEEETGQAEDGLISFLKYQHDLGRADMMPWLESGKKHLGTLDEKLGAGAYDPGEFSFSADEFRDDPFYQFLQEEGQRGVERSKAARGGLASSGTLHALSDRAMNVAGKYYGDEFGRQSQAFNINKGSLMDEFNQMSSMAGMGQTASSQLGNLASQYGQNYADTVTNQANMNMAQNIAGRNRSSQNLWNTIGAGIGIGGLVMSDRRVKKNIEKIGEWKDYNVYSFEYLWDNIKRVGVMAQEVLKIKPEAVVDSNGYLAVNYGEL